MIISELTKGTLVKAGPFRKPATVMIIEKVHEWIEVTYQFDDLSTLTMMYDPEYVISEGLLL